MEKQCYRRNKQQIQAINGKTISCDIQKQKTKAPFNALGSTIKFITGNMYYIDAEKINQEINQYQRSNTEIELSNHFQHQHDQQTQKHNKSH